MATPDNLSGTDEIESSDLLAVWSSRNRDSRRVSYGQFRDAIADSVENDMIIAVESANASAEIAQTAAETAAGTVAVAVDELRGEIDQTVADALAIPLETAVSAAALAQAAAEAASATLASAVKTADLSAANGAALVGTKLAFSGAVLRTQQDKNRDSISVQDFGAKGDLSSTDMPAMKAAISAAGIGGEIKWLPGTYLLTEPLVQLQGQKWTGLGGQRSVTFKKAFNGDAVIVGALGTLENINIDGDGSTYSGRGFYIPSGFSHRLERCRAVNTQGPSLEFAFNIGGGAHISDFEGLTTSPTTVPAILIAGDDTPHPRFFEGVWLSGGIFELGAGGGNGCSINNFYVRNFKLTGPAATGSALFHIANGRVASISDTTTISGSDIQFANVAFSGPVALQDAQGVQLASTCTYGAGISEDASNCQYNSFFSQPAPYVPVWSQTSAGAPSLGNGSTDCYFSRQGYAVVVDFQVTFGSTSTNGDSLSAYRFSIPYRGHRFKNQRGMMLFLYDASGTTNYVCNATIGANEDTFTMTVNGNGVRLSVPVTLAASDTLQGKLVYFCR